MSFPESAAGRAMAGDPRRGERIGWTAGWAGGFLWVAALALRFAFGGRPLAAAGGGALLLLAALAVRYAAPWRHPRAPYYRLFAFPYAVFLLAVVWAVTCYGGFTAAGVDVWTLVWFLPLLIPFGPLSRRRWVDGEFAAERPPEPGSRSAPEA